MKESFAMNRLKLGPRTLAAALAAALTLLQPPITSVAAEECVAEESRESVRLLVGDPCMQHVVSDCAQHQRFSAGSSMSW